MHMRAHGVLTASGTAALALVLMAAGIRGRKVAIPNGVCLNVPLAVLYSGNEPIYLDIDPRTLGLSIAILDSMPQPPAAVIAVHAYGHVCDIEGIGRWCKEHGAFLIEDAAAALGARAGSRPAGGFGDAAVLSFGAGKVIDCGGGGAVLLDDPRLTAEVARLERALPPQDDSSFERIEEFSRYHTALYNAHYGRDLNAHAAEVRSRALPLRESFMRRAETVRFEANALRALDTLEPNIESRRNRAAILAEKFARLENRAFNPITPPFGSVPWRFNLLVSSGRDGILKQLLARKLKVSSWFPSANLFLEPRGAQRIGTPVSDRIGDQILNLWVNHEVDDEYLARIPDEVCSAWSAEQASGARVCAK